MKKYTVFLTDTAQRDLLKAKSYISHSLKNPRAADALIELVGAALDSLEDFPARQSLVRDEVLASWGVRVLPVKKYLLFYVLHEKTQRVYAVRFLYGKSNWRALLGDIFSGEISREKAD